MLENMELELVIRNIRIESVVYTQKLVLPILLKLSSSAAEPILDQYISTSYKHATLRNRLFKFHAKISVFLQPKGHSK